MTDRLVSSGNIGEVALSLALVEKDILVYVSSFLSLISTSPRRGSFWPKTIEANRENPAKGNSWACLPARDTEGRGRGP